MDLRTHRPARRSPSRRQGAPRWQRCAPSSPRPRQASRTGLDGEQMRMNLVTWWPLCDPAQETDGSRDGWMGVGSRQPLAAIVGLGFNCCCAQIHKGFNGRVRIKRGVTWWMGVPGHGLGGKGCQDTGGGRLYSVLAEGGRAPCKGNLRVAAPARHYLIA